MKKQHFDFKNLAGKLSREEMKAIKGGDGPIDCVSCRNYPNLVACCIAESPCPQFCFAGSGSNVCWQCTPS